MAKIDKKGTVRGTVGPVVYRGYRDMNIIQGKPRNFKQSVESVKTSTEFGLSSTTAAVVRQAFQPAYIHRDGEAVSRSTQVIYRSIRGSLNAVVGRRDLHDADLNCLKGLEFNIHSKISDVLQCGYRVEKDNEGSISVFMAGFDAKKDLHVPAWIKNSASQYRIRFSLIGFNFRQEYYELLDVKDVDFCKRETLEEQLIRFDRKSEPDQLLMVSISILAYRYTPMSEGYVLLNSKEFSPCAIIAAYEATACDPYPAGTADLQFSEEQLIRKDAIYIMGYDGNRLLRELQQKLSKVKIKDVRKPKDVHLPPAQTGQRVSFKKG